MVVSVEAGITLEALQEELGKAGQFLPLDPFKLTRPHHRRPAGDRLDGSAATALRLRTRLPDRDPRCPPDGHLASAGGPVVKNVSGYD